MDRLISMVRPHDPAFAGRNAEAVAYARTRVDEDLPQPPVGKAYTYFRFRRLTRSQLFDRVDLEVTDTKRFEAAFRIAVKQVEGPLFGRKWSPAGDELTDAELDEFDPLDIVDIGRCVYFHSYAGKGSAVSYQLQLMSGAVLDGMARALRSAERRESELTDSPSSPPPKGS